MSKVISAAVAASLCAGVMVSPARANDDAEAIAGALAILGIAALAHHEHHYNEGYMPSGAHEKAMFEAGYRDGLHNAQFDTGYGSRAYSEGFHAGQKDRDNRLAHRNKNVGGTRVPAAAMNGCVSEVASSLNVGRHDVHAVNAGQEGSDNFYIELAVGHKHLICGSNSQGQVFNLRNGRL